MKEDENPCLVYVLSLVTIVFFGIWSIASFADANGWAQFAYYAKEKHKAAAFFAFFSSLFCTLIVLLTCLNMYKLWKRDKISDDE